VPAEGDDGLEPVDPLRGDEPDDVEPGALCAVGAEDEPVFDDDVLVLDTTDTVAAFALLATLAK